MSAFNGNGHTLYREEDYVTKYDNWHDELPAISDMTVEEARQLAIQYRIDPSSRQHQNEIAKRRQHAAQIEEDSRPNKPPGWYKWARKQIVAATGALVLLTVSLVDHLLFPVIFFLLFVVEVSRIQVGVELFDSGWRTGFMSVVVMAMYVSLLFQKAGLVRANQQVEYEWSIGLTWRRIKYMLSLGRNWQPKERQKLSNLNHVIRMVGILIVLLGTTGVMQNEIRGIDLVWYEGLRLIVTDSTLLAFLTMLGGSMVTAVLLSGLHYVSFALHSEFVKIMPEEETMNFFGSSRSSSKAEADRQEIEYLYSQIVKKRQQQNY